MTADEYLALGETPERYELIDGVVMMSPSPSPLHQTLVVEILSQLASFARGTDAIRIFPDTDLRLGQQLIYRPDLSVYLGSRMPRIPARLTEAPDLIVEILSPHNRPLDLVTKRGDYDRFGVAEYWVVDPQMGGVRRWARAGTALEEQAASADRLESRAIPGFARDMAALRKLVGEEQG